MCDCEYLYVFWERDIGDDLCDQVELNATLTGY